MIITGNLPVHESVFNLYHLWFSVRVSKPQITQIIMIITGNLPVYESVFHLYHLRHLWFSVRVSRSRPALCPGSVAPE